MGTTDVLVAAAGAAVALLALATLVMLRAGSRSDRRLHATLAQIDESVAHLAEALDSVAARAAEPEPGFAMPRSLATSLDLQQVAEAVAVAAAGLLGVDAAAVQASLESGEVLLGAVGVPRETAGRLALEPPDGDGWESAHLRWSREPEPVGGALAAVLAVPVVFEGARLGTVLAFTRSPALPAETEAALARLAAAAVPAFVNARRYQATLELVRTDTLTGLGNRRSYDEHLAQEIERARRTGTTLSLLLIDLDDFGMVNKAHSLQAGDAVLATFAGVLRTTARAVDVVCRRGGEEFVALLPDTGCTEAQRFFARLRSEVSLTPFPPVGRLTFSAGLTQLAEDDTAVTIDERASWLMNESKRTGKDRLTHDCA